jgi:hypothetical protein
MEEKTLAHQQLNAKIRKYYADHPQESEFNMNLIGIGL